jgi:NADPH:quinone reductase-like Zn-dependent oxidoreductase
MGARVVVYGSTGGMSFPVNAPELFLKNVQVIGTNVGNPAEFAAMIAFVAEHRIEPVIDRTFTLEEAKAALAYLENGHSFGKIVVIP